MAKNILKAKKHQVELGTDCRITVEARPVHLMVPSLLEVQYRRLNKTTLGLFALLLFTAGRVSVPQIDTDICPQRILISNLPKMDTESMLNKLEIHFSKSKHGGGEVETCDLLPDSGTVVLTFLNKDSEQTLLVNIV